MQQTVIGVPDPIIQSYVWDYDYQRGWVYHEHWEGRDQQLMEQLQQDYVAQGISCRLDFKLGMGILDVLDSTKEWVLDTWQLDGQDEQLPWLNNPIMQEIFNANYPQTIGGKLIQPADAMASVLDHLNSGDSQTLAFSDAVIAPMITTYVWYMYPFAQAGVSAYRNDAEASGYVMRHGTNVSNQYQVNIADFGTGQVYSTAQFLSEISDGGLWINPCPLRLQYKCANLVTPPIRQDWIIGWLKGRSTETFGANNRDNIVTTYTYGQWALGYYYAYTGSTP